MRTRWFLAGALMLASSACSVAPVGKVGAGCTGVPGDFRTPAGFDVPGSATHGPGASGRVIEQVAVARPPGATIPGGRGIPLLYVFDPDGDYVTRGHRLTTLLERPAFVQAESDAYWGEVLDDAYYEIPNLDKCSQAAMLDGDLNFHAPPGGIQFVQFVVPECDECEQISAAIEAVIADHPALPVRWVRIAVPRSVGTLRKD